VEARQPADCAAGVNAITVATASSTATARYVATHPPLEKRLANLAQVAREMGRPV